MSDDISESELRRLAKQSISTRKNPSGSSLLILAELYYDDKDRMKCMEVYVRSIKKLLTEDVNQETVPDHLMDPKNPLLPPQTLAFVWRNLCAFVTHRHDEQRVLTRKSHPEVFELLESFRPSSKSPHTMFKSPKGRILLKALQVMGCHTLGKWTWLDEGNAPRAAKIFQEGLGVADSHPPFCKEGGRGLNAAVFEARTIIVDALNDIKRSDAEAAKSLTRSSDLGRKDTTRLGDVNPYSIDYVFSTTCCTSCGKREVKLQRCKGCQAVQYCDRDCQVAHWPTHKAACRATKSQPASIQAPSSKKNDRDVGSQTLRAFPLNNGHPIVRRGTAIFFQVREVSIQSEGWMVFMVVLPVEAGAAFGEDLPRSFDNSSSPAAAHDIAVALKTLLDGDAASGKAPRMGTPAEADPDKEFFFCTDDAALVGRVGRAMAAIPKTRTSTHNVELMLHLTAAVNRMWEHYLAGLRATTALSGTSWQTALRSLGLVAEGNTGSVMKRL